MSLSFHTPGAYVITLVVSSAIALVSSVSVSMVVTGPMVYSSNSTRGNSKTISGWFPGSVYISPYRSSSVSHSDFSFVRFLNSKLEPYYFVLGFPPTC